MPLGLRGPSLRPSTRGASAFVAPARNRCSSIGEKDRTECVPSAESVLSGHRLGHQGVERPNEESSSVAQLPEIKQCGREDSNLHECYLTRSLAETGPSRSLNHLARPPGAFVSS